MTAEKTVAEMVEKMAAQNGIEDIPDSDFVLAITRLDGHHPDRTIRLLAGLLASNRVGLNEYVRLAERHHNER